MIAPDRLPTRALTDAETTLRKLTFNLEAGLVLRLLALYRAAYRDLLALLDNAQRYGGNWRPIFEREASLRLALLKSALHNELARAADTSIIGSYYGRLWLIAVALKDDVLRVPPVETPAGLRAATPYPQVDEAAWAHALALEMDDLALRIRRAVAVDLLAQAALNLIARRLFDAFGMDSTHQSYRGSFNRVQVIGRTLVNGEANRGAQAAYRSAPEVVGYEWLTAEDERVCPLCAPLDGKRYPLTSVTRPPLHLQCRCSIVPILSSDAHADPDAKVRMSLQDWAAGYGLARELADDL